MLTRHESRETKWRVVAGGGLEPPDLQGMNLASYQLLHPAIRQYSALTTNRDARRLPPQDIHKHARMMGTTADDDTTRRRQEHHENADSAS
jgi:hypothetical protein